MMVDGETFCYDNPTSHGTITWQFRIVFAPVQGTYVDRKFHSMFSSVQSLLARRIVCMSVYLLAIMINSRFLCGTSLYYQLYCGYLILIEK